MLRQRVLTAIILIPLALWLVLYSSVTVFTGAALIFVALIAWEWALLTGYSETKSRLLVAAIFFGLVFFGLLYLTIPKFILLTLALVIIGLAMIAILSYPTGTQYWSHPIIVFICGVILCLVFAMNAIFLKSTDLLLYVMLLVWAADSAAYFVGKRWGTHRLIPTVSPGKSQEGLYGGLAASVLVAVLFKLYFSEMIYTWPLWISGALIISLVSVEGDLLISMLKRQRGLKDTGAFLPGHGGILDRIDSLIPAVIVSVALIRMWS